MAVVVIGGLITSTILTLVGVPVVFSLVEGLRGRLHGLVSGLLGADKRPVAIVDATPAALPIAKIVEGASKPGDTHMP